MLVSPDSLELADLERTPMRQFVLVYGVERFPFSRPEILEKWIHAVQREKWKPSISSTLCSKHFLEDCYQVRPGVKVKLLKEDAVPSVFDFPVCLPKETSVGRPSRLEPSNVIVSNLRTSFI
ncbi:THAP domain-containing protein 1 [Gryllus bimaculatus]|nr:THAP domain-containing protein 1 [Gryllus bimaculatus]